MPKFPFKRPRIISKKFPEIDSTIDGVTKSLNELVFSYAHHIDRTLQKKHIMMAISSLVLLLVLGNFLSPKGKAESSIFYPETCLGGWINPQYAQGEGQTTSNGDESQFTKNNSAVLPKNTDAEMYCGNFKGTFDQATKPTKIIVSLALTKGTDILAEDTIESGIVGTSSQSDTVSTATSSLASTTDSLPALASSTVSDATGVDDNASSTATTTIAGIDESASSTEVVPTVSVASATPSAPLQETTSAVSEILNSLREGINNFFENNRDTTPQTDTVVVPPPEPSPSPADTEPTSFSPSVTTVLLSYLFQKVQAEETEVATSSEQDITAVSSSIEPQTETEVATSTPDTSLLVSSSTILVATTSNEMSSSTSLAAATTSDATSEEPTATTTEENQFQNNFLEVFYTFDGVNWILLGDLNEISMKYRTFEIPVTASTSWSDMSQLQVKVIAKKHSDDTPTLYLDGIKVEVLYEGTIIHTHPDFTRDTILKDETVDGVRVVTIINSETSLEEIWYMYLDDVVSSSDATSMTLKASSTLNSSSTIEILSTATTSSTTDMLASTTIVSASSTFTTPINPLIKNVWKKHEGILPRAGYATSELVKEIKKQDLKEDEETKEALPNFSLDIIKRMKGTFFESVVVQIERGYGDTREDELWLYDLTTNTQEKIGQASSTTIAVNSPLGMKDGYLFWVSSNKQVIYAYDLSKKVILEQPLSIFDASLGERAELHFEGLMWKVIVSNDTFSFYSGETGEVFSDENAQAVELLRERIGLDSVLGKEALSKLNLPVEAEIATTSQQ